MCKHIDSDAISSPSSVSGENLITIDSTGSLVNKEILVVETVEDESPEMRGPAMKWEKKKEGGKLPYQILIVGKENSLVESIWCTKGQLRSCQHGRGEVYTFQVSRERVYS